MMKCRQTFFPMAFGVLGLLMGMITIANADDRIKLIENYLQGQQKYYDFNGNVLIVEQGNVVYRKSFGKADYRTGRMLNDTSVFELASVSKQFTAAGILLLEKRGMISLRDTLRKFFPELPYSGITIHMMLTHTSGLPDYDGLMSKKWDHRKIAGNNEMISFMAQEKPPVSFSPGEKWEYSNTAYAILASIIEKVSGQSFREYMHDHVFLPLKMKHTRVYNTRRSGEVIDNYAYGYVWSDSLSRYELPDSLPETRFVYYLDGIQGDGIINSTTSDLILWQQAIFNKTLLGATTDKMFLPHALYDTLNSGYYGYGLFVEKNELGVGIGHSGGWPGYATQLIHYPDKELTLMVLSNNNSRAPGIERALAEMMMNGRVVPPYVHQIADLDSVQLDHFTGMYIHNGRKFEIIRNNDSLFQVFPSGYRRQLTPESPTKLYIPSRQLDLQLEVSKNRDGSYNCAMIYFGVRSPVKRDE